MVSVVGAWTLVSYLDVDESGRTRGGPLGEDPYGLLIYSPTGHVSVSMMSSRTGRRPSGTWAMPAGGGSTAAA